MTIIQTETPPNGSVESSNARGMKKIAIISEMTQDRTILNRKRFTQAFEWYNFQ